MNYLWWIPSVVLLSIGSAYCTYKNSTIGGALWFVGIVVLGFCFGLVYSLFTKWSYNLILDNLIYNALIVIVVTSSFIYLDLSKSFTWNNWTGLFLIVIGVVLFKWR